MIQHVYMSICLHLHVYIYIYIERERERENYVYTYMYIYIYVRHTKAKRSEARPSCVLTDCLFCEPLSLAALSHESAVDAPAPRPRSAVD